MSNPNMLSLNDFDSFGDVAAEDDAVLNYFLATNAVTKIADNESFLVLGRKGTGKTALVRHFTERKAAGVSKSLNLRGYPWNVHETRIDRGASDIEAYVSSWRYLIAIEIASTISAHPKSTLSIHNSTLEKYLTDNYGGTTPKLSDILRPKRLVLNKLSVQPSVMGNQLGGVELERGAGDHKLGLELNALSGAIMATALEVAGDAKIGTINLHFDELDQGLSKLDEARSKMLVGLVIAAREIRLEYGGRVNPIVYLRTDLWDEFQFSDKNKITQTRALSLGWNGDSLLELVETRLQAKLGPTAKWDLIAETDLMRGSQSKWNHILARTFLRPRDVIQFLNIILGKAKRRKDSETHITNKDIVDSREEYSVYLKNELDDEIRPHWAQWEEALRAVSGLSTITFERDDFEKEYDSRKSKENPVSADEALALLYRFSVIGYEKRSGYGGTSWAFQYTDPEAGWDNKASRFKVHLGLKEYAKLRETRS